VVWVRNSTSDTRESWSVYHSYLTTPERRERRYQSMDETNGGEGFEFWHALDIQPEDVKIAKKRFSAFIQGSSGVERHLRGRDIDTVLIAGTATNVCCESTARDAMMLNFKTVMVPDALAAQSEEAHNASLSAFYSNFGDVQTVSEVLESLDRGVNHRAQAPSSSNPRALAAARRS
jgi:nicotinamidase-related amidase